MSGEDLLALGGLALCGVFFSAVLKKRSGEMALAVSLVSALVLFAEVLRRLGPLLSSLGNLGGLSGELWPTLLKALGLSLIGQLLSRACRDAGESALSWTVELAAKCALLALALPLLQELLSLLGEMGG